MNDSLQAIIDNNIALMSNFFMTNNKSNSNNPRRQFPGTIANGVAFGYSYSICNGRSPMEVAAIFINSFVDLTGLFLFMSRPKKMS